MLNMNKVVADALNVVFRRLGVALNFELVTPKLAAEKLKNNPALLAKYGLSQQMSGDASDEQIVEAKGRKFVTTLINRIKAGEWKWYMGIIAHAENGGCLDGVTRYIAISQAGADVWALVYSEAKPEDFYEYDDPNSARVEKDIFHSLGIASEEAGVLSHIVPKAAGSVTDEGVHKNIIRDKWYQYFVDHKEALLEAVRFVKKSKGDRAVARKNLTALIYYRFVTKGGRYATNSKRLLEVYKYEFPEPGNKVEQQMVQLASFFRENNAWIHERIQAMPLFLRVMTAALRGDVLRYKKVTVTGAKGETRFDIAYPGKSK
jgi:hypothetical protein